MVADTVSGAVGCCRKLAGQVPCTGQPFGAISQAKVPLPHRSAPGSVGLASRLRRAPILSRQQRLQRRLAVRCVVRHALRHCGELAVAIDHCQHQVVQCLVVSQAVPGADLALLLRQAHVPREMVPVPVLDRPVPLCSVCSRHTKACAGGRLVQLYCISAVCVGLLRCAARNTCCTSGYGSQSGDTSSVRRSHCLCPLGPVRAVGGALRDLSSSRRRYSARRSPRKRPRRGMGRARGAARIACTGRCDPRPMSRSRRPRTLPRTAHAWRPVMHLVADRGLPEPQARSRSGSPSHPAWLRHAGPLDAGTPDCLGKRLAAGHGRDAVPASRNAEREAEAEILGRPSPEGPTPLALAQVQRVIRSCAPGPCPG